MDPVAKKLGHHWKRVALELGTGGFVVKIETKYEKVREQALYSLLIWEETSGVAATEKRLIDALDYCGMKWAIGMSDIWQIFMCYYFACILFLERWKNIALRNGKVLTTIGKLVLMERNRTMHVFY